MFQGPRAITNTVIKATVRMTKQTLNHENAVCTRCTPPCNSRYKKAGLLCADYTLVMNYDTTSTMYVHLQPCVHWTGLVGIQQRIFAWRGWYLDSIPVGKERYQSSSKQN